MDLRTYLQVFRRHYRLMAAIVLACLGLAVVQTASSPNVYISGATLFVSAQDNSGVGGLSSNLSGELLVQQRVKSYADILQSQRLAVLVAQDLGINLNQVAGHLTATVPLDTVLLKLSVKSNNPQLSMQIANAAATRFATFVQDIEKPADGGPAPIKVSVTQPALAAGSPTSPKPATNLVLGFLVGLALAIGAALGRQALDTRINTTDLAASLVGAPVLGVVSFDNDARKTPLIVQVSPNSIRAEAFRTLRTNLQFIDVDHELASLVITSSIAGEGKSTTCCNLAISLAQAGASVILVEADLRRPRIAEYMGLEGAVGLTNVLVGSLTLPEALQPWGDGALQVLASGPLPPNPSELLGSAQMDLLLRQLEGMADIVLIDAPPLLPVTDAAVLGTMTSGILMVVAATQTRQEQVKRAALTASTAGGVILGTVFNKVPRKGVDSYGYGYGGYYNYEARRATEAPDAATPAPTGAPTRTQAITQAPTQAPAQDQVAVPAQPTALMAPLPFAEQPTTD